MLESAIFSRLFPYTAKRQPVADEVSFDDIAISAPDERMNVEEVDYNDDPPQYDWSGQRIEYGNDLPSQGGITGNGAGKLPQYKPGSVMGKIMGDEPVTDDRVAIEQGGASTQPFIPTQQELTPDTSGMSSLINNPTIDLDRPEFELPYPQPTSMYEQTQNALAKGQYDAQNPRNRDKGFKGALKEALQNFAFGLSHAQPGMGFWESMALGGTGLGAGLVDRSSNERREAMRNLPMLQQNAKIASDEMDASQNRLYRQKQMENIDADNKARDAKDKAALALSRRKAFSQRYKNFDPKNATPAQIRELAEFGETPDSIGKYDFGSRDSKTIGADTYKWDNNANAYVIQGNLHDKSKALTSLTFETPDQEVVTMWVPSTQAATILAQRERTGWQLRQRQELQEDAQNFRLGQKNQPTTNSANYSSPTAPKTGKTSEKSARAYLQTKGLKGDALENAIKTARANGEIQ